MRTAHTLLLLLLLIAPAADGKEPIVTTDLLRIRVVTGIDVARDGSKAVFAVQSIAQEAPNQDEPADQPEYAYRSHLFLLDLFDPAAQPRQLTFGDRMDSAPRLSPDGRRIAFVRGDERQSDQKPQIWILRTDGGEARQLTDLDQGAAWSGPGDWSPDGTLLLVGSMVPLDQLAGVPPYPAERPGLDWSDQLNGRSVEPDPDGTRAQIRAWLAANAKDQDPTVISRLEFQDEQSLRGPMQFAHLFLVQVGDAPAPPRRITDGFFDHGQASFMPDGHSVVYASRKLAGTHPDRVEGTDVWRINTDGTGDRMILSLDGWSLESPLPNDDGSLIAVSGYQVDEPAFRQLQLGIAAADGAASNEVLWLTNQQSLDASVWSFDWMPNGVALAFTTAVRGGIPLMTVGPGVLEPAVLFDRYDGMQIGVQSMDAGGPAIAFTVTGPANPCVLMVRDSRGVRMAYDLNPWVADKKLSMPQEGWVSRPDGGSVQYWVMEPVGRKPGAKYPMVLELHGGPSVMWGPGELTMWHEFQLLCNWGYGVVYSNPRGSGGYGYEFQRGNFQNWGEGPAGDVLAVVDQVAINDWVDTDRLVVTGGSYAGYLTAWIVAYDRRFKAAVAQRGVYDLATFFGEGNAWRLVKWAMGGNPYDARYREIMDRNSPFTHVKRIQTPLLIMHADNDLRAGVSQSEMLYRALKELGRPVEYVRYPNAGHDLSRTGDPHQRMDRLDRIIDFFERHIENPAPAPQVRD